MGALDRFFKQEIQGISLKEEMLDDEIYRAQLAQQMGMSGMGYSGGQPLPPMGATVIPPAMEKEVMEKYLDVPIPKNLDKLKGTDRFWLLTSDVVRHLAFTNLNAAQQSLILTDLQITKDFDGCDNVDGLIQDHQLLTLGRILTDKSRSDLPDGLRERIVPSVGYSIFGDTRMGNKETGERPRESRSIFSLFGGKKGYHD